MWLSWEGCGINGEEHMCLIIFIWQKTHLSSMSQIHINHLPIAFPGAAIPLALGKIGNCLLKKNVLHYNLQEPTSPVAFNGKNKLRKKKERGIYIYIYTPWYIYTIYILIYI